MFTWWSQLGLLEQVLYIIAIPSTLILIIQTVLLLFGLGLTHLSDAALPLLFRLLRLFAGRAEDHEHDEQHNEQFHTNTSFTDCRTNGSWGKQALAAPRSPRPEMLFYSLSLAVTEGLASLAMDSRILVSDCTFCRL